MSTNTNDSSWRGVPMQEIYGSQSPWSAPEFPLVSHGHNHSVLYHIPNHGRNIGSPPKPQIGKDKWDQDHVRMPCSSQSLYPVEVDGTTSLKRRWEMIEEALKQPIHNSEELAKAILTYNTKFKSLWRFRALHKLFSECLEEEESQYFFSVTLPEIAKLALALPKLVQSPIPLLKQHKNRSISLSQQQISSLLANAFFCTFPRRNTLNKTSEYASYPHINFSTLYESHGSDAVLEKLKCICHYFRRVTVKVPGGCVTYARRSVPPRRCPDWRAARTPVAGAPLHVDAAGTIEDDGLGLVQVDFANKYLGGGVLGRGCVQEEIRFVICPELLVSMLFTEVLRPNEALLMIGCERFSSYSGYGSTFQWAGDYSDGAPRDSAARRRCAVLAIDALPLRSRAHQYRRECIVRELNKAWVGMTFYAEEDAAAAGAPRRPGVATGNWGCGAFGGSAALKSLLQLMAAAEAGRPVAYYTFGDTELRNNIANMYNLLARYNVTVGQLFDILVRFSHTDVLKSDLYPFIHQSLVDAEASPGAGGAPDEATHSSPKHTPDSPKRKPDWPKQKPDTPKHSPDLFSEELEEVVVLPTKVANSRDRAAPTVGNQHERPTHTSMLFDEMSKFDDTHGTLNLNQTHNKSVLDTSFGLDESNGDVNPAKVESSLKTHENVDSAISDLDVIKKNDGTTIALGAESMECEEQPPSNLSFEIKKKITKKITDYFSKS